MGSSHGVGISIRWIVGASVPWRCCWLDFMPVWFDLMKQSISPCLSLLNAFYVACFVGGVCGRDSFQLGPAAVKVSDLAG